MTAAPEAGSVARASHVPAAGLTVVAVGLLVGLPAAFGDLGRLAAVLVLQLGLVLAWVLVTGIQSFAGSLAVGAAAAVAADLLLGLSVHPSLGGLLAVFGVGFVAVVLQQMFRRPRHDLVASMSGTLLLVTAVGALASLILLGRSEAGDGRAAVALLAVGGALVVGHLVDLVLPRPPLAAGVPQGLAGLVLSVLTGALVAYLGRGSGNTLDGVAAVVYGAVLGMVASLMALAAAYLVVAAAGAGVAGEDGPACEPRSSPWGLPLLQVVLPLAACAPVALAMQTVL